MSKSYPRHNTDGTVTLSCWLIFTKDKITRMTLMDPGINSHQRKIYVELTFPKSLFSEPELRAKIKLAGEPQVVPTAETIRQIEEAVEPIAGVLLEIGEIE